MDYIGGVMEKLLSVANARYFICLHDGNTDSSVMEQEVVYVLFLDSGVPIVKYVSMKSVENANLTKFKKALRMCVRVPGKEIGWDTP